MRLAIVDWEDSMSGNRWGHAQELLVDELPIIRSVGWILDRPKGHIHLVASAAPHADMFCLDIMIPTSAIRKITYIGKKYDRERVPRG